MAETLSSRASLPKTSSPMSSMLEIGNSLKLGEIASSTPHKNRIVREACSYEPVVPLVTPIATPAEYPNDACTSRSSCHPLPSRQLSAGSRQPRCRLSAQPIHRSSTSVSPRTRTPSSRRSFSILRIGSRYNKPHGICPGHGDEQHRWRPSTWCYSANIGARPIAVHSTVTGLLAGQDTSAPMGQLIFCFDQRQG